MGEVKEIGTRVVTREEAEAMIQKATNGAVQQMNAQAPPDNLVFVRDPWAQWTWQRFAPAGELVGASARTFASFQEALDNFNRVCKPQVKLDVMVAEPAPTMPVGSENAAPEEKESWSEPAGVADETVPQDAA